MLSDWYLIAFCVPITLGFHWSRADALGSPPQGKPSTRLILEAASRLVLYVTNPKPPDVAEPGDTLTGTWTVANLAPEVLGTSSRPSGWPVSLIVPPKEIKEKEDTPADDEADASDPTSEGSLDEAVRAVRIGQLAKLSAAIKKLQPPAPKVPAAAAEAAVAPGIEPAPAPAAEGESSAEKLNALGARYGALLSTLQSECIAAQAHEQRLELASAHLTNQEALCERGDATALAALVRVADELIALIDTTALAAAYGVALDKDDKVMTSDCHLSAI